MKRSRDKSYRRGAVVGLTTAELFMLTSFMLITALLLAESQLPREAAANAAPPAPGVSDAGARAALELEVSRLTSDSERLSRRLTDSEARRRAAETGRERAASALEREEERRRRAEQEAGEAAKWVERLSRRLTDSEGRRRVAETRSERAREAVRRAEAERDAAVRRAAETEEVRAAARRALRRANEALEAARQRAVEAQRARQEAEQRAGEAERALLAALEERKGTPEPGIARRREKGGRPPCWYTTVRREDGTVREKALYLLDVAVHDGYIVLGRRDAPPGGPDDEDGHYAAEFEEIGAQRLPYGERLSNRQARRALEGVAARGRSAEVRSYACIFYAMVWDHTNRAAKHRWREAHDDLVQRYLGTYVVRDPRGDPWPH